MEAAIRLVDESSSGTRLRETTLRLASERVTAAEIIRARVLAEVRSYNDAPGGEFQGLVQPEDSEKVLNGYRLRKRHRLDPEAQCASALTAFESNGFFMLVDDQQVAELDQPIVITPDSRVTFVKLVPLVGG